MFSSISTTKRLATLSTNKRADGRQPEPVPSKRVFTVGLDSQVGDVLVQLLLPQSLDLLVDSLQTLVVLDVLLHGLCHPLVPLGLGQSLVLVHRRLELVLLNDSGLVSELLRQVHVEAGQLGHLDSSVVNLVVEVGGGVGAVLFGDGGLLGVRLARVHLGHFHELGAGVLLNVLLDPVVVGGLSVLDGLVVDVTFQKPHSVHVEGLVGVVVKQSELLLQVELAVLGPVGGSHPVGLGLGCLLGLELLGLLGLLLDLSDDDGLGGGDLAGLLGGLLEENRGGGEGSEEFHWVSTVVSGRRYGQQQIVTGQRSGTATTM